MNKTSIIGKKYIPHDNSYCVNLTSASNYPYENNTDARLAGTMITSPKICTIVSEPFTCKIKQGLNSNIVSKEMILVDYNNETYSILYHELNVE